MKFNLPQEVVVDLNELLAAEFDVSKLVREDYEVLVAFFIFLGMGMVRLGLEKKLTLRQMIGKHLLDDQTVH